MFAVPHFPHWQCLTTLQAPTQIEMSTVKQLQAELKKRGLDTTGKKAELEQRLEEAKTTDSDDEQTGDEETDDGNQPEPEPEADRLRTRDVKFFANCTTNKSHDIVPAGPKYGGVISWIGQAVPTAIQVHC